MAAGERWERIGRAIERERGRMSQTKLAEAIDVTQPMVSDWEAGKKRPGIDQLEKIERTLNLPAGFFLRIGGYVDTADERSTEKAIMADAVLGPGPKEMLLAAYRDLKRSVVAQFEAVICKS